MKLSKFNLIKLILISFTTSIVSISCSTISQKKPMTEDIIERVFSSAPEPVRIIAKDIANGENLLSVDLNGLNLNEVYIDEDQKNTIDLGHFAYRALNLRAMAALLKSGYDPKMERRSESLTQPSLLHDISRTINKEQALSFIELIVKTTPLDYVNYNNRTSVLNSSPQSGFNWWKLFIDYDQNLDVVEYNMTGSSSSSLLNLAKSFCGVPIFAYIAQNGTMVQKQSVISRSHETAPYLANRLNDLEVLGLAKKYRSILQPLSSVSLEVGLGKLNSLSALEIAEAYFYSCESQSFQGDIANFVRALINGSSEVYSSRVLQMAQFEE